MASPIHLSCGDDEANTSSSPSVEDPSKQKDNSSQANQGLKTIVGVAASSPDFSTLVKAVKKSGLVGVLSGAGPFTVFAPNNQAFIDSGISEINSIPVDALKSVLLYHVIAGKKIEAAEVKAGVALSAADLSLFIGTDRGVTLNSGNSTQGGANVIATDVQASNGVIHVVDRVLLPPDVTACARYGKLSQLASAIDAAADIAPGESVLQALQRQGPFTLFAPNNKAFGAIRLPQDPAQIRNILLYHVLSSKTEAKLIPSKANTLLQNKWGNPLTLLFNSSSGVMVNDAKVLAADIICTNGVVHVIDKVLIPPDVVTMAAHAGLSELVKAATAAAPLAGGDEILEALKAEGPFTVLAPTNAAFEAITAPSDRSLLRDVLLLHVINAPGPVLSTMLPSTAVETLLNGKTLNFDTTRPSVSSDGTTEAQIVLKDINVTNGVVHVIDKVLLP